MKHKKGAFAFSEAVYGIPILILFTLLLFVFYLLIIKNLNTDTSYATLTLDQQHNDASLTLLTYLRSPLNVPFTATSSSCSHLGNTCATHPEVLRYYTDHPNLFSFQDLADFLSYLHRTTPNSIVYECVLGQALSAHFTSFLPKGKTPLCSQKHLPLTFTFSSPHSFTCTLAQDDCYAHDILSISTSTSAPLTIPLADDTLHTITIEYPNHDEIITIENDISQGLP